MPEAIPENVAPADAGQAQGSAPTPAGGGKRRVAVCFDHVTKTYKLYKNERQRALGLISSKVPHKVINANDDVSFTIYRGESVALLGANGAGKSTALKMITGVSFPTKGTVTVEGRVSAMLELKAGFDKSLTGRENIHMRGQVWGMSDEEIAKIEPKVIKFADLGAYIDQPMRTYSSGMKARLGFAIASSINPDILVVDEALSVGDKRFSKKCKRRVSRIMARKRVTVLFVTHNPKAAMDFCERGIVFEKGRLLFDGPIADALAFYEHREDELVSGDASEEDVTGDDATAAEPAVAAGQGGEQL